MLCADITYFNCFPLLSIFLTFAMDSYYNPPPLKYSSSEHAQYSFYKTQKLRRFCQSPVLPTDITYFSSVFLLIILSTFSMNPHMLFFSKIFLLGTRPSQPFHNFSEKLRHFCQPPILPADTTCFNCFFLSIIRVAFSMNPCSFFFF